MKPLNPGLTVHMLKKGPFAVAANPQVLPLATALLPLHCTSPALPNQLSPSVLDTSMLYPTILSYTVPSLQKQLYSTQPSRVHTEATHPNPSCMTKCTFDHTFHGDLDPNV